MREALERAKAEEEEARKKALAAKKADREKKKAFVPSCLQRAKTHSSMGAGG